MKASDLSTLIHRLNSPLPGWEAQKVLSPVKSERYRLNEASSKKAGVLALLFPDKNKHLQLVFIKRPDINPLDKHSGQVSFPGGKYEVNDIDLSDTAIREAHEEIGLIKNDIQIIGHLSPIYVFVSNFLVQPTVAYIDYSPNFILQESEVDYIITAPIFTLLEPSTIKQMNLTIRGIEMKNVPYFNLDGEILWGATAMITSELIHVIREI